MGIGHPPGLLGHRRGDLAAPVPDVDHQRAPASIQVLFPRGVVQINALASYHFWKRAVQDAIEDRTGGKPELIHAARHNNHFDRAGSTVSAA